MATLAYVELVGPCRFAGWDDNGLPTAKAVVNALVQVAAVNVNQTWNTFSLFPTMLSESAKKRYGIEVHKELVYAADGSRIEAITANPRALQGRRGTFFIANETAEWTKTNDGHRMMDTARANAAKIREGAGRTLEICNAFVPGEDSVAERTYMAWEKTRAAGVSTGDYYDSVEAPADTALTDRESLVDGLSVARGDASWLDLDRLVEEIQSPVNPPSVSRRLYLNQIVAAEDALITPQDWDQCFTDDCLKPGDMVTLGFDGGESDDSTVLVALRVSDRFAETVKAWEKPQGAVEWEVNREDVDGTVEWAMATYNVVGFHADVQPFTSYVDKWGNDYRRKLKVKATSRHAVALDMRGNKAELTQANERLMTAVMDGSLKHGDDPVLRRHALNAKRRVNNYGVSFGKENAESPYKVDAWAALLLADLARHRLVMAGKTPRERRAVVFR